MPPPAAVRDAQRVLNETLTVWKDAIGDREKAKEDLGQVAYGHGRSARDDWGVWEEGRPATRRSDPFWQLRTTMERAKMARTETAC